MTSTSSQLFKLENARLVSDTSRSPYLFPDNFTIPADGTHKLTHRRTLRFDGSQNTTAQVSPSGLVVVNTQNSMTQIFLTQYFSSGVHLWELFCPQDCYGVSFGVKNKQTNQEITLELLSSTGKFIVFKLDMEKLIVKSWINLSNTHKNSRRQLTKGEWTGFVRFKGIGKSIILNPNPIDPEGEITEYNPFSEVGSFNEEDISTTPKISEEPREAERQESAEASSILQLKSDKLAVTSGNKLRVIHKNKLTQRFQLQNISKVAFIDNIIHIQVSFNSEDFEQLRNFCETTNLKFFKRTVNKFRQHFYIQYSLEEWENILRHSFDHCDILLRTLRRFKQGNNAEGGNVISEEQLTTIYRILLEKFQQIRPHSFSPYRQLDSLELSQSSKWDYTQQFFKNPQPKFIVSKSLFQNNFPPLEFPSVIENIYYSNKYLVVRTKQSIELFNTELIPVKLMTLDLQKGFDKDFQLKKFAKEIESFKVYNPNEPKLYKILADCLVESKLAKRTVKPQPQKVEKPPAQKPEVKFKMPPETPAETTSPVKAGTKGQSILVKKKQPVPPVQPEPFVDPSILNALVAMGFPVDKCKKSLIETKNVSVDAALQHLISQPQTFQEPKTETLPQKVSKEQWSCEACTLINFGGTECTACTTTRPPQAEAPANSKQEIAAQVEEVEEKQNRISPQIKEPLKDIVIIQTGYLQCPLIVVALFDSKVRVRIVGSNPTYLKYFYANNDEMYLDLKNLVPNFKLETITLSPLTHLEQLFNNTSRPYNYRFGWITLEDNIVQAKADKIVGRENSIFELDNKKYLVSIVLNRLYEPKRNSVVVVPDFPLQPQVPVNKVQTTSISYSKQINTNSNNTLDIDLIFTQIKEGDRQILSSFKVVNTVTQPLSKSLDILPLVVHSAPSCCNYQYPSTSIVYGVNNIITLKHQHGKLFTVDTLVLQTLGLRQANPLIKKGYIYTTNHLNKQPVVKYLFEIDCNQDTVSFAINSKVPSKYLIIQPILDQQEQNQPPFEMFLHAITGSSIELSNKLQNSFELLQKYIKIQLEGETDNKGTQRLDKYSIKQYLLNDPIEIDHLDNQTLNNRVQEYLKGNVPVDILVRISLRNLNNIDIVRLKQVSIEGWRLVGSTMKSTQTQNDSKRFINSIIEELFRNGDQQTTNSLSSFITNQQFTINNLLQEVPINKIFTYINRSSLELKQIVLLVIEIRNSTEFANLKVSINELLSLLDSPDLTILGLDFIIEIIKLLEIDNKALGQKLTQSLNRISNIRSKQYSEERKRGNYHLNLQNSYFSNYYYKQVEKEEAIENPVNNRIISKFIMINHNSWRKYVIDLTNMIKVDSLMLSFESNLHKKHLFIQIYKASSETEKELIYKGYYEDWIWSQLCRFSYSEETKTIIENSQNLNLNSLIFNFQNVNTRYLIVDINYDLVPLSNIASKTLITSEIIPEVFGTYQGQADPLFIQYFNISSTKPTFISYAKFHKLSQFSKYIIKKENWSNYYYDNQQASKVKKDSALSLNKLKQSINTQVRGLDYEYTVTCKIIELLSRNQSLLPLDTILSLYKTIVEGEEGPIRDKALSLIRKSVVLDGKIYLQLIKLSKGESTLDIFKDLQFKQTVLLEELNSNPTQELINNLLILLKFQKVKNIEIVDKIIQNGLELNQRLVFLLETYPWTTHSSQLIKQLLRSNSTKQKAFKLVKDCKDKNLLIKDIKNWLDSDERLFDEIITHVIVESNEQISVQFKAIISKLLDRRGKKTYRQMNKIISLCKSYGINCEDVQKILGGFNDVKDAYDLLPSVISIVFSVEKGSERLVKYLIEEIEKELDNNNLCYRNLIRIIQSLKTFEVSPEQQKQLADSFIRLLNLKCTFGGYEGLRLTQSDQYLAVILANQLGDLITTQLENNQLENMIEWYMLNNPLTTETKTPVHLVFEGLKSKKIEPLILKSQEHSTKHIVEVMFKIIKQLDSKLNTINSVEHRIELDEQIMFSFKNIYQKLNITSELLEQIVTKIGLFEYVVERIKRSKGEFGNNKINRVNLTNSLSLLKRPSPPQDWLAYKSGNNTNQVCTINFSAESYTEQIIFRSEVPVILDNILISFLVNNGDKKLVVPKKVEVWLGNEEEDLQNIGSMEVVQDDHFDVSGVRVYGINRRRFDTKNLDSFIEGLNEIKPVQYIKFVIEKGEPISLEDVLSISHKPISTSAKVSFISITGTNRPIESFVPSLIPIFPILSQLYNFKHQATLLKLLQNKKFVNLLKQGLQSFCSAMQTSQYFEELHSFILAFSKNDELGDFMIDKYLILQNSNICSQLVFEIVLSNYDLLETRLVKLHNFIMKNIGTEIKYNVVPFIVKQTKILQIVGLDLQKSPALITLTLSEQDLKNLLNLLYTTKLFRSQLLKFISSLLLLKAPLTLSIQNPVKIALESLEETWTTNDIARKLFAILIVGSEQASIWILDQNRIDSIIELVNSFVSANAPADKIVPILQLLTQVCYSPNIKNYLQKKQAGLNFFKLLTEDNNNGSYLTKPENGTLRKVFVSFIINSLLGTTSERELAILLKQSLEKLITNFSNQYVVDVFLPILNSSTTVPVCFQGYDVQRKKYVLEPCKDLKQLSASLSTAPKPKTESLAITSKILDQKQLQEFQNQVNPSNYIPQLVLYQSKGDGQGLYNAIRNKIIKTNDNFVIFVEAKNKISSKLFTVYHFNKNPSSNITTYEWNDESFIIEYTRFQNEKEWKVKLHKSKGTMITLDSTSKTNPESQKMNISVLNGLTIKLSFSDEPSIIDGDFKFVAAQYFSLKPQSPLKQNKESTSLVGSILSSIQNPQIINNKYVKEDCAVNYLRRQNIYYLPKQITISHLKSMINILGFNPLNSQDIKLYKNNFTDVIKDNQTIGTLLGKSNVIADIQYNYKDLFNQSFIRSITKAQAPLDFLANDTILNSFEKEKGFEKLIYVVESGINSCKNVEMASKWRQYIQQLKHFSSFPKFFAVYMKQKDTVNLLFNILIGLPDKDENKKMLAMESQATKNLYKNVSDVLSLDNSAAVRQHAIKNKFISTILERLHLISKQQKRKFVEQYEEEKVVENNNTNKDEKTDQTKPKLAKKKGTGYGTDTSTNTKWATNEKAENNKEISEQLEHILAILQNFLNVSNWKIPKSIVNEFMQSCLLPLIENTLRAGTLLEISKDSKRVMAVLNLLVKMSKHNELVPCLLKISPKYQPSQSESIIDLLKGLADTATIFVSCLNQDDPTKNTNTEQNKAFEQNSRKIVEAFEKISEATDNYDEATSGAEQLLNSILAQPSLLKKYRELLKDLKFDYINMKESKQKHHYASSSSSKSTNSNKLIRLAQQLADLSTSLPTEHTNAIYVRCDKERIDYMQALIMGSNGTPYGHGAFLFDIYFDENYPNGPPKVNLTTTGGAKVRFNPNLYSCGKVCLSLLGTWRGNASENWDPKLSTLLQVLVSIQAIIMSDDIYFNEPGFQGEQGTEQGARRNQAYSNIVRYCNVKFAMIGNIRNPPQGFETVIRRHFYLKKDQILEQVARWVKFSEKRQASYVSLVNDHNSTWCTEFKNKNKYPTMLKQAFEQLKTELNKLSPPSINDITPNRKKVKKVKAVKENNEVSKQANLQQIDVSYNESAITLKQLDFNDEKVKDRWSRYIGAMGIDAVSKQAKASVLVFGIGPFSLEVVKNLILSGCKRLTICDDTNVSLEDLSGGFYFGEGDVGKNRVSCCLNKLQELNQYVKVDRIEKFTTQNIQTLKEYTLVLMTEGIIEDHIVIDDYCRTNGVKFILANAKGPFFRLFNDFGDKFEVLDKNGEQPVEVMIKSITNEQRGIVTLLEGAKHPYEDGEVVILNNVLGMESTKDATKSINGTLHKITTINSNSFYIEDTRDFKPYTGNGTAKNVKLPISLKFDSLKDVATTPKQKLPIDQNMCIYDFSKMQHNSDIHFCFLAVDIFFKNEKRYPNSWDEKDADKFITIFTDTLKEKPHNERLVRIFCMTFAGNLPPLCAFFGGYVAQEIVKAITQKYKPTQSLFYGHFTQVVPKLPEAITEWSSVISKIKLGNERTRGLEIVVGKQLITKLESCKVFMIGAGAIGCELLKNFAMINLACGKDGMITLTDPDHIETSNLNRQFLFRQKHIRKPKSSTAAASAIQMNPLLKGHVSARLDKIHDATKGIYSDEFFQSLNIVANALDNVQARRYVDQRCVDNKIPLLESGTLGPKGHVQVIIPYKTESYGSKNDPNDEGGEIPHCTLKMFPEETLHCIEWARDKFGQKFSLQPKSMIKILDKQYKPDSSEKEILKKVLRQLQKRPRSFDDCIYSATMKFYSNYRNNIKQLLYTYPLDAKTKNGDPFWKLPKRPPTAIEQFDPEDILHCTFISSYAVMLAKIFNIAYPKDFRSDKERRDIGKIASKFVIEPFVPSDKKAKEIMKQTKDNEKEENQHEKQQTKVVEDDETQEQILEKIKKIVGSDVVISAEQFQKDDDANGHIDFIYAMANLRSLNYKLDPMDWVTTKLKAGRIVPALSTTTTSIAGLQTLELIKYIASLELGEMRNTFLNLAVPLVQLSEPGEAPKIKIHDDLSFTIWDKWEINCTEKSTFDELFEVLQKKYKLKPRDILQSSTPVYLSTTYDAPGKEKDKKDFLKGKLLDVLEREENVKYIDLIITFSKLEQNELIKDVPKVRLNFGQ